VIRVKSKKPGKREAEGLKAETDKLMKRSDKRDAKRGIAKLNRLVGGRGWSNKRMAEEQRKERMEGKMSGITLSLPKSFTDLQTVAKQQASTVKKLRSHVGLSEDEGAHQSTLKEACARFPPPPCVQRVRADRLTRPSPSL
jgi:hypothetical protein